MMIGNVIIIVILPPYMELFKALRLYLGMSLKILRFDVNDIFVRSRGLFFYIGCLFFNAGLNR